MGSCVCLWWVLLRFELVCVAYFVVFGLFVLLSVVCVAVSGGLLCLFCFLAFACCWGVFGLCCGVVFCFVVFGVRCCGLFAVWFGSVWCVWLCFLVFVMCCCGCVVVCGVVWCHVLELFVVLCLRCVFVV